jgi:nicotinate-nucleotide--dimethylbenzimidazole phosphoribosyltransferase
MGIGNTTSAAALAAAVLGRPAHELTGRGTGVDDAGLARKREVIAESLLRHFGPASAPITPHAALGAVGGYEIAGLVGAALEAASRRMIVVLDGFISSTAGLLAARLDPRVRGYFVAAHRGAEQGHTAVLAALGLRPLLDLGLRLGEGSGAVLALNMIHAAADLMREMATFDSAGVSDRV